ncbi:hypothetical protein [Nocardia sp. alder85J]|uniref:hypothetical protein n=1 Tax=Nocardia sp. alder85J TaxID=2862949 RepID=UPI001CD615B6|nr:hypothetical protein [Nocardia sp. alder85J]MCX4093780.1 hypothetical protein [Nocardia sp. alder85J]
MTTDDEQGGSARPEGPAAEPVAAADPAQSAERPTEPIPAPAAPGPDASRTAAQAAPAGSRARRVTDRWRGSRPLRIGAAVLAAMVIAGLGFGTGLAVADHGGRHTGRHHSSEGRQESEHRFHLGGLPWMYRFEHDSPRDDGPRAERPLPSGQPGPATSAPAPAN